MRYTRSGRSLVALAAATAMVLGGTNAAVAQSEPGGSEACPGVGLDPEQVSIQMFTYAGQVWGGGEFSIEDTVADLADVGFVNIEPFTFHGHDAAGFKEVVDTHGIAVPTRHGGWGDDDAVAAHLADAATLEQEYVGSGGFAPPGIGSYEDVLATAQRLNEIGALSVANGTGPIFGHNHDDEFTTTYEHEGEELSAWEILVAETDPDLVTFQLDVYWAAVGGHDPTELIEDHGDRIALLHMKDGVQDDQGEWDFADLGEGELDLESMVVAGEDAGVDYYIIERDFSPDPLRTASVGFDYLTCTDFFPGEACAPVAGSLSRDQVSLQLFTFHGSIGNGPGQVTIDNTVRRLADIGLENLEPYTYHGLDAAGFRELADQHGIAVPSRHGGVDETSWDDHLAEASILGQEHVGSGGFAAPGIARDGSTTLDDVLQTAATLDRLGERSVANGTGPIFGHNHAHEFTTTFQHDGEVKSAWEILVEETDPEFVTFQLDVYWAAVGGYDPVELIEEHGDRMALLHMKDGVQDAEGEWDFADLGEGELDLEAVVVAGEEAGVDYYVIEHDRSAEPFATAKTGLEFLTCTDFGLDDGEPTISCPEGPGRSFPDVAADSTHRSAVGCAGALDLLKGRRDGSFVPGGDLTRGQVASILARLSDALGRELPAGPGFPDLDPGDVHADAVSRVARAGYLQGYTDGTVGAYRPITRGQLASVLVRFVEDVTGTELEVGPGFADDRAPHAEAVRKASAAGMVLGYEDGTFRPTELVRRDQAASMLVRTLGQLG